MKTTKFKYLVFCFFNRDEISMFDECDVQPLRVECVTLSEARFVASRYPFARIQCIGEIEYIDGVEKNT